MEFSDNHNYNPRSTKKTSKSNSPVKNCSGQTLTEKKPAVTEKYESEYGDESRSLAQLEDSDYQNSEARIRMNDHQNERYLTSLKLSIEKLRLTYWKKLSL